MHPFVSNGIQHPVPGFDPPSCPRSSHVQTGVQRVAVATAANMCRGLTAEHADAATSAAPILISLLQYQVGTEDWKLGLGKGGVLSWPARRSFSLPCCSTGVLALGAGCSNRVGLGTVGPEMQPPYHACHGCGGAHCCALCSLRASPAEVAAAHPASMTH